MHFQNLKFKFLLASQIEKANKGNPTEFYKNW